MDISLNKAKYRTRTANKTISNKGSGNNAKKSLGAKGMRNLTVRAAARCGTSGMTA